MNKQEFIDKIVERVDSVNADNARRVWWNYLDECHCKGKSLTIDEYVEDIENSIGFDEVTEWRDSRDAAYGGEDE